MTMSSIPWNEDQKMRAIPTKIWRLCFQVFHVGDILVQAARIMYKNCNALLRILQCNNLPQPIYEYECQLSPSGKIFLIHLRCRPMICHLHSVDVLFSLVCGRRCLIAITLFIARPELTSKVILHLTCSAKCDAHCKSVVSSVALFSSLLPAACWSSGSCV
jgi:hypothetical protein